MDARFIWQINKNEHWESFFEDKFKRNYYFFRIRFDN